MSLYTVTTGSAINASDVNQLVNVMQRPSGTQESGQYYVLGNSSTPGGYISQYIQSQSRGSTPASVSYDTSIGLNTTANISTDNLSQYGFHISGQVQSAPQNASKFAGNYTIQY